MKWKAGVASYFSTFAFELWLFSEAIPEFVPFAGRSGSAPGPRPHTPFPRPTARGSARRASRQALSARASRPQTGAFYQRPKPEMLKPDRAEGGGVGRLVLAGLKARNVKAWADASRASGGPGYRPAQTSQPCRGNGAYISPCLRRRAVVRRTDRLGRSLKR